MCADCQREDHTNHRPELGGSCVGCACPVTAKRDDAWFWPGYDK